jgi:hypothetical protein
MSAQLNGNLIKKLVSVVGIASVSVALSFPAFALTNTDASSSNLLAQSGSGTGSSNPSSGGSNQGNDTSTPSRGNTGSQPSNTGGTSSSSQQSTTSESNRRDMYSPADSSGRGMRALTGGDSVRGINWVCLNNPNPQCGGGSSNSGS